MARPTATKQLRKFRQCLSRLNIFTTVSAFGVFGGGPCLRERTAATAMKTSGVDPAGVGISRVAPIGSRMVPESWHALFESNGDMLDQTRTIVGNMSLRHGS